MEHKRFLAELGRRLRERRSASGLSLTDLARRSGLSRRYVTEAEAGRANVSLIKLADLARALGVPLRELCDIPLAAPRRERVALVGLRGAGKSTIGRRLALRLEVPFVELDQRVEEIAGTTLAEIFNVHGEAYFHRLEGEALEDVLAHGERVVIAAGGSIVASAANFARLRESCRTVWLKAEPAEHFQRVLEQGDRRPMENRPRAMSELQQRLEEREPLYAQCEIEIATSESSVDEVVRAILAKLEH
jgi:XRE family transcriptional regulator, aerobic/anaerobic benzoate catabolism transcriptional regulator